MYDRSARVFFFSHPTSLSCSAHLPCSTRKVPTKMDGRRDRISGEDISATIMRRAKALHSARYSMEAGANLDVLREEKKASAIGSKSSDPFLKDGTSTVDDPKNEELIRVWNWIERVEGLCSAETGQMSEEWYAKGLVDAGVYKLLRMDASSTTSTGDTVSKSSSLGCDKYDSSRRRAALNVCGLVGKFSLRDVLAEAEAQGNYERSAALAVFHGDIGAAVAALQRGVDRIKLTITEEKESGNPESEGVQSSAQYAETLQLVGMCVAGFRAPSTSEDASSAAVWRTSCEGLLQQRQDLSSERARTANVPYLRAMLLFLLNVGKSEGPDRILQNEMLSLSDRVAFACMYLSRADLQQYLLNSIEKCKEDGNLEGIIITGLDQRGFQILQSFVDIFSDCQTAALISSRVLLPSNWVMERAMCSEWLDNYRDLLNSFSMWQSRAMFDVGRAELFRNVRDQQAEDAATAPMSVGTMSRNVSQGRRGYTAPQQGRARPQPIAKQPDDVVANYPPQLYARCNYCNTSLPLSRLSRQENIASGWLSRQKPVLSCCPSCKKPLPRCALCLLPLGCLNPYMELKRERNRISRTGASQGNLDDLSSLSSSIPFAEWFTWCMSCKHGGHAHHLVGWFAKHDTCPVSGCNCRCQFDGIQTENGSNG